MKLWVDDIRRPPDDSWVWARTNDEARELMLNNKIEEVSLDHDMGHHDRDPDDKDSLFLRGDAEDDGTELAKWMVEQSILPPEITIHSWNPIGAKKMGEILCTADPDYAVQITIQPYEVPQDRRS